MKTNFVRRFALCACVALAAAGVVWADEAADRKAALARKRDVMYYATGYDPCYWPKGTPYSQAAFWNIRLNALLKTPAPIDTLVYAPVGAFAHLSAKIPSATMPTAQPSEESNWMRGVRNAIPDFVKAGTDPLKEAIAWARKNKKEFIAALPVNMSEHGAKGKGKAVVWDNYFWSPWKDRHPGDLMADAGDAGHPPYASPTAVDYGKASVRTAFAAVAKEIAEGYDIDGLLIDYMTVPTIFRTVAWGEKAGTKEWQALTDMMARIRASVNAAGAKRGRPILLAVRVPDSLPFCRNIGIDLQAWMDQKLVDFIVSGGPMELSPYSYMAEITKKSGIPFYPCFDESGIWVGNDSGYQNDDERPTLRRHAPETFRARLQEAAVAGAAGVMYHNPYHWIRYGLHCVCGGPKDVATANKRYHVCYRNNGAAGAVLKDGQKLATREQLLSGAPYDLKGAPAKFGVYVWDDLKKHTPRRVIVTTEASVPSGIQTTVTVNGRAVKLIRKIAGSQQYELPVSALKYGRNEVIVKATGKNRRGRTAQLGNIAIDVIYTEAQKKEGGAK